MKISLYVPQQKENVRSFLAKEIAAARNIKDKNYRLQVETGLNKIHAAAEPGNAYFWEGESEELHIVPYHGKDSLYECGREFITGPLQPVTSNYLLVVMDANQCTIGVLRGKKIEVLWKKTSYIQGKHNQGGQSAARFQRLRQEQLKQWYKTIGSKLNEYGQMV